MVTFFGQLRQVYSLLHYCLTVRFHCHGLRADVADFAVQFLHLFVGNGADAGENIVDFITFQVM